MNTSRNLHEDATEPSKNRKSSLFVAINPVLESSPNRTGLSEDSSRISVGKRDVKGEPLVNSRLGCQTNSSYTGTGIANCKNSGILRDP